MCVQNFISNSDVSMYVSGLLECVVRIFPSAVNEDVGIYIADVKGISKGAS